MGSCVAKQEVVVATTGGTQQQEQGDTDAVEHHKDLRAADEFSSSEHILNNTDSHDREELYDSDVDAELYFTMVSECEVAGDRDDNTSPTALNSINVSNTTGYLASVAQSNPMIAFPTTSRTWRRRSSYEVEDDSRELQNFTTSTSVEDHEMAQHTAQRDQIASFIQEHGLGIAIQDNLVSSPSEPSSPSSPTGPTGRPSAELDPS